MTSYAAFVDSLSALDRELLATHTPAELVIELFRQRDQARRIAAELEAENASLRDTIADRELAA